MLALIGTNKTVTRYAGLEKEFFAQANSRGLVPELRLGGIVEHNIPVNLSANTNGAYGTGQFAGTIGETIYSRYHVFLDYPHNRIIFEPTPEAATPFKEGKTFGLTLIAAGDDLHTLHCHRGRCEFTGRQGELSGEGRNRRGGRQAGVGIRAVGSARRFGEGRRDRDFTVERGGKPMTIKTMIALVSIEH